MTSITKIAITGASGRMGRMLIEATLNHPTCELVAALDLAQSHFQGQDAGNFLGKQTGIPISANLDDAIAKADVLIDFTRPEGTLQHLELCQKHSTQLVIGTTGFTSEQKQQITQAAQHIAVVFSPNMAVGVNATFKLLEVAAKILASGYDIEVIETHHRHKIDAPSGTALKMGEVVAQALGRDLNTCAVYGREGVTGERNPQTIGFSTIRGGDVVGDHTVLFAGIGERIEITHKSSSRATYAHGSIRAAKFLADKNRGLFDMQDVLGLKDF